MQCILKHQLVLELDVDAPEVNDGPYHTTDRHLSLGTAGGCVHVVRVQTFKVLAV